MILNPASITLWATMRPAVLARAPECPSFLLDAALKKAAREFFQTSRVWRTDKATLLTTAASTTSYAFTPPAQAQIAAVQSAWIGDVEVPTALAEQDDLDKCMRIGAREPDAIFLTREPQDVGRAITGVVALMPADAATGIPSEATRWQHELSCGAASFLVTEPNKPWSQPNSLSWLRGEFERGIREASMSAGPTRRVSLRMQPL